MNKRGTHDAGGEKAHLEMDLARARSMRDYWKLSYESARRLNADLAQDLRNALSWEEKRMGAVSGAVLEGVIARLDAIAEAPKERGRGG